MTQCLVVAATACAADQAPIAIKHFPALPDAYGFAGSFAGIIDDEIIVAGGANFPDGVMPWNGGKKVWHSTAYALSLKDPAATWQKVGKLPQPNGYGVSLEVPGGFLMIGGGDASKHFATVTLVKKVAGKLQFTIFPELPQGVANACGVVSKGQVHLVGGQATPTATTALNQHYVLDLDHVSLGWKEAAPLPVKGLMLATAGVTAKGFMIMGGCSLSADSEGKAQRSYSRATWHFVNDQWIACEPLPRAAVAAASPAWNFGEKLCLVGGDDGTQVGKNPDTHSGFARNVLAYDLATDSWQDLGSLEIPVPVTLPAIAHGKNYLLISGEVRPGVRTPAVTELSAAPQP